MKLIQRPPQEYAESIKKEAETELARLFQIKDQEERAENMLSAKGFENTIVYITDENVTVNINQKGISRSDTAKIVDIIYEVTKNNNIKKIDFICFIPFIITISTLLVNLHYY